MGRGSLVTPLMSQVRMRGAFLLKLGSAFEPQAMFNGQGVLLFYRIWLGDWTQRMMVQIHSQW
jgi:hypothetical protein